MTNKRRMPRRNTVMYLRVSQADSGSELGRMADISQTGLLLISSRKFPTKQRIHVNIHLPPSLAVGVSYMPATIETRWSKADTNPQLILNGCLLEVADEHTAILNQLIEHYGFNNDTIDFRRRFEKSKLEADEEW